MMQAIRWRMPEGGLMTCSVTCRVTAHFVPVKGQSKPKTTILMKFDTAVMQREQRLPS